MGIERSWRAAAAAGLGRTLHDRMLQSRADGRVRHLVPPVMVFAAALLLYGALLARAYSGDDLQYALVIEQATTAQRYFHPSGSVPFAPTGGAVADDANEASLPLNPRYLLEYPTSIAAVAAWRLAGWDGDAIAPILATRVLAGALGILWFFLALRSLCGNMLAAMASAGIATSSAYWTYSTHVDQSITMVALLCLAFLLLVRHLRGHGPWSVLLLPVVLALATLYNFTALITAGIFLVAATLPRSRASPGAATRQLGLLASTYGLIVAGAVLIGIAVLTSPANLLSLDYWRSATFAGHPEYGIHLLRDAARAALGMAKAQVAFPSAGGALQLYWDSAGSASRFLLAAYYGGILLLMLLTILTLADPRMRPRSETWVVPLLVCWFLAHAAFNYWWDPGYIKYWLLPLAAWWALAAVALARLRHARPRLGRLALPVVAATIALAAVTNLLVQALPQRDVRLHPWPEIARMLRESDPDALFISPGRHPLDFHVAYFARRDVVAVDLIRYGTNGDAAQAEQVVLDHVQQHRAVAGRIYVYGLETLGPAERQNLLGLVPETQLREAWVLPGLAIYEFAPIP